MKEIRIEKLNDSHPAKAHGFEWDAAVLVDGYYCGVGKFCRTREEAEEYASICTEGSEPINTLAIYANKWFQKSAGNTYHKVTVIVNGKRLESSITYGYDDQYLATAAELLKENNYMLPCETFRAVRDLRRFPHFVKDVKRKKIYNF